MWTDLGTTALFAGIALAVTALWKSFGLLTIAFALPRTPPGLIATAVLTPLPGVPLILLLLLLSRPGNLLILSEKQRYLAWALVLIRSASFIVSIAETWRKGLHGATNRIPESDNLWLRFSQSSARFLISDVLALLSGFGFLLFLVALARPDRPPHEFVEGQPRLIRKVALIVAIIGGLGLMLTVTSQYGLMQYRGQFAGAPNGLSVLRSVLFGLPGMLAPILVYSGVRREC